MADKVDITALAKLARVEVSAGKGVLTPKFN